MYRDIPVYFTSEITPESLVRIYEKVGIPLEGNVAVKISTGEPGGHNFLQPALIKDLVQHVNGTIVECCTAYEGKRQKVSDAIQVFTDHGFADIAPCDLLDRDGDVELPIRGAHFEIDRDYVGSHITNYDSILMLSHFKGHMMAGYGGAMKNMSIGLASSRGKAFIHSGGESLDPHGNHLDDKYHFKFLRSMADACKAVMSYRKNILYINVANNLSVDCDCDANPAEPHMKDLGIFASVDPVAVDRACIDAVMLCQDPWKAELIERIDSRQGESLIDYAHQLELGSLAYKLINID